MLASAVALGILGTSVPAVQSALSGNSGGGVVLAAGKMKTPKVKPPKKMKKQKKVKKQKSPKK